MRRAARRFGARAHDPRRARRSLYGNRLSGGVSLSANASYQYCMLNCPHGSCKSGDDNCFGARRSAARRANELIRVRADCPLLDVPIACATGIVCGRCNALRAFVPPAPTPAYAWPVTAWLAPFLIVVGLICLACAAALFGWWKQKNFYDREAAARNA